MESSPDSFDAPVLTAPRARTVGAERIPAPEIPKSSPALPLWVVSTVHHPDDVRIFWKQAVSLAAAGYAVTAVFWTNDRAAVRNERIRGVDRRVLWKGPESPGPRQRFSVLLRTLRLCLQSPCTNFIIHDPELIPVGLVLEALKKKVIYDAHEDLPAQVLHKAYLAPWQRRLAQGLARGLVSSANRWLSGQLCATAAVQQRYPRSSCVVRNFPLLREFQTPVESRRSGQIAYVGGLTRSRGLLELIQAVNQMQFPRPLVLAGRWESEAFRAECERMDLNKRVRYLGMLDRREIGKLLAASDIGVAVLHPVPAYVEALPVKLFEYMAAGLAVVVSDFPLWRGIVANADCGVVVEPGNVEALRVALDYLVENAWLRAEMGSHGRTAVEQRYTWEAESSQFLSFVESLFGTPGHVDTAEPVALPA